MPIQVKCPECEKKLKAPDHLAGKKAKCPRCKATVTVAEAVEAVATPAAAESAEAESPNLSGAVGEAEGEEGSDLSGAVQEQEDEMMEGRMQKAPKSKLPLVIGAVVVVAIVVAAVLFLRGGEEAPGGAGPLKAQKGAKAVNAFDYVVPANADVIVDVDFGSVRNAPLWSILGKLAAEEGEDTGEGGFEAFVQSTMDKQADDDTDPEERKAILGLVMTLDRLRGGVQSDNQDFLLAISAVEAIDWDALVGLVRRKAEEEGKTLNEMEVSGYTVYSPGAAEGLDADGVCVARISDRQAIAGKQGRVKATLAAMEAGTAPTAPAKLSALATGAPKATILVATTKDMSQGMQTGAPPAEGEAAGPKTFEGGTLSLDLSEGLSLEVRGSYGDAEEAAQAKMQLDKVVSGAAMIGMQKPELGPAIQALKTNVEGGEVSLSWSLSAEQLADLIKMAQEMAAGMAGGMAPGGMPMQGMGP